MPAFTRGELADLNVFVTICRRQSFREAATELGVTTSALSHAMRNLEARLGVKLLNRTSRSVSPTAAGAALAKELEQGLEQIASAIGALDRYRASPAGRLRLNVPRDAARLLLDPILPRFVASYPDIELDVTVDDRMLDIVAEGFDAGMRYGDTVPGDMIATPLTPALKWIVVGAPAYFARHGRPKVPQDLMSHNCIRMRLGDNTLYKWELGNGSTAVELDVPGALSINESDGVIAAAVGGLGLGYVLERNVSAELSNGTLEAVLMDWAVDGPPLSMYYPSRRQTLPGLRHLIDMIRSEHMGRAA
ncbi:LysR family transcriptional regulator [Pandoraea apista]|mgnify:FL=1|uniref:LysR family transcriptional regulator n=2 Tax=Pandoraea apista TaxID=93218 RepID=A0A0B5F629_9BURK|nr:LysR family transcriptional regulator [Pandoraea apista]AJE99669.1 LysR family transcriptional regulator [Pandoraea apista]AKH73795.1 LysR family transcriptional regulator [Pandoraea apista]AKI62343.1 LysR family transcriptional regulator [Pandoraea apista]ALS64062.1 LysR family transcriptional regulator [Pandoraea apista]AVF40588.1 LysR family transcriptional regulator [Pandoraea apista]